MRSGSAFTRGEFYTPHQSEFSDAPSGRLALVIRESWGHSVLKSWDEGENVHLEDRLNEFVLAITVKADKERESQRRHEEEERERVAEQNRRAEAARLREEEVARRRELERENPPIG